MHRSRIGVALIDHPGTTYDLAAAFWSAAVGRERHREPGAGLDDPYESLGPEPGGGIRVELQRTGVGTPARVHLDVETDDVDAEVARLTRLGARVTTRHDGWAVLEDPGGMPFCVVPVQTEGFAEHAATWP